MEECIVTHEYIAAVTSSHFIRILECFDENSSDRYVIYEDIGDCTYIKKIYKYPNVNPKIELIKIIIESHGNAIIKNNTLYAKNIMKCDDIYYSLYNDAFSYVGEIVDIDLDKLCSENDLLPYELYMDMILSRN